MKVNPAGIQSYQNLTNQNVNRQDRSGIAQAQDKQSEAANNKVVIEPQNKVQKPALAVKAPEGSYDKYLSTEERQALDLLFARFKDSGRFGPGFQSEVENESTEQAVGRLVDVRV